jgi:hypothetical protein
MRRNREGHRLQWAAAQPQPRRYSRARATRRERGTARVPGSARGNPSETNRPSRMLAISRQSGHYPQGMPSGTRHNSYNTSRRELASFVSARIPDSERVLATICVAVGPRHRLAPFSFVEGWIARAMPWSRRCGLVVTSERVLLVEWSKLQPRYPRRIVLEAPRSDVFLTRCTEGWKSAALELSSGDDLVRLYLYDRYASSVQALEVALPRVPARPTTAKVSAPEAARRPRGSSRRRPRRQRKEREVVLDLPLHMSTDYRQPAGEDTRHTPGHDVRDPIYLRDSGRGQTRPTD